MVSTTVLRLVLLAALLLALVDAERPGGGRRRNKPSRRRQAAAAAAAAEAAARQEEIAVNIAPDSGSFATTCGGTETFELFTGFVFSSSDEIIDSRVGTLLVSECLEYCKGNKRCRALNFETGLCVLFKSAAEEDTGKLAVSQFPVFTLYAQKVCVSAEPRCASPWAYESVPDVALDGAFSNEFQRSTATSRNECVEMCLTLEEGGLTCRAISYNAATGECVFSRLNRNMAGRNHILTRSIGAVYVELACVATPLSGARKDDTNSQMCEFTRFQGRILKTVDAVYQDLTTTEECRERCMKADFGCYSFDFMSAGERICRLSHHSSATLAHIKEPYLEIRNATTYEMQSCYKITVECRAAEMLARITSSTIFNGLIYAKDRPNSCRVDVDNDTEFNITMPYNDMRCAVNHTAPGNFSANLVIQHHDMIVTSADVGLALHCRYNIKNQTVTSKLLHGLSVKSGIDSLEYFEETVVDSPNVVMRVTDQNGMEDIIAAQVGANLALRFEITDRDSPYEIFVRKLIAMDGSDDGEFVLIDDEGCPTEHSIMEEVIQVDGNGTVLLARFQAFKFPTSDVVQFSALVTPCLPRCEPVQCHVTGFDGLQTNVYSYGKRKKREVHETDLLVAQSVRITDKFEFRSQRRKENSRVSVEAQGSCSSFTGVVVAGALFLAAQLVMLMAWSYLWHKKRATKQIDPMPPQSLYMGSNASRASSTSYLTD